MKNYEVVQNKISEAISIPPMRGIAKTHPLAKILQEVAQIENLEQWLQQEAQCN